METINNLMYLAVLIYSSITDCRHKIIENRVIVVIITLAVINARSPADLAWAFFGSLIIAIPFLYIAVKTNKFGGGDVKFIFANGMYLGLVCSYFGIILGLTAVIGNHVLLHIRKKGDRNRQIPLAPFLSAGYIIVLFGRRLLLR